MSKVYREKVKAVTGRPVLRVASSRSHTPNSHNRIPSFSTESQTVFEVQSLPVRPLPLAQHFTGSSLATSFVASPRAVLVPSSVNDPEDVLISSDFGGNRNMTDVLPKRDNEMVRVRVLAQEKPRKSNSGKELEKQMRITRIYGGNRAASFSQPAKKPAWVLARPRRSGISGEGIAGKTMLPSVRLPVSRSPFSRRPSSRSVPRQKSISPTPTRL